MADLRWHYFTKQAAALDYAASNRQAQVWSLELDGGKGARSYIVASREAFWIRYRKMNPPTPRHYYEVIRAEQPCQLYFDLEFCRVANPEADGEQMVRTLCDEVRSALEARYGTAHSILRIIDLESSTCRKFSRHVIVRMDGAAFAHNGHVGQFVHGLLSSLAERRANEPLVDSLFVAPPATSTSAAPRKPLGAENVCFVDVSVYSRNRCFRLCTPLGAHRVAPATSGSRQPLTASHKKEPSLESPCAQINRARQGRTRYCSLPDSARRRSSFYPRRRSGRSSMTPWSLTSQTATSCSHALGAPQ